MGAGGPKGIRISELTEITGVSRATIHHYVQEGLLPRPKKTGKTMAYYDRACVQRIEVIKSLQERYLPLAVIKRILTSQQRLTGPPQQSLVRNVRAVLEPAERAMSRAEALATTGVDPPMLDELERLGIVRARRCEAGDELGPHDIAVLRVIGRARAAGLGPESGFSVENLLMYQSAMTSLLAQEIEVLTKTLGERASPEAIVHLATAAEIATDLMVAMRRKAIAEMLSATAK